MLDTIDLAPPPVKTDHGEDGRPIVGYLGDKETVIRWLAKARSFASAEMKSEESVAFAMERSGKVSVVSMFQGDVFVGSANLERPTFLCAGEILMIR